MVKKKITIFFHLDYHIVVCYHIIDFGPNMVTISLQSDNFSSPVYYLTMIPKMQLHFQLIITHYLWSKTSTTFMTFNGTQNISVSNLNVIYYHSHALTSKGFLVDRVANGVLCGTDVRVTILRPTVRRL